MKRALILGAVVAMLATLAAPAFAVGTGRLTIHRNPSGTVEGLAMFELQVDTLAAAGGTVICPVVTLKAPAWTCTGGSTSYYVLPLTIQVSTTTGPDTMHVAVETSVDNGVTWETDASINVEAVAHYAQGTREILYLVKNGEQVRITGKNLHGSTAILGAVIRGYYPSNY